MANQRMLIIERKKNVANQWMLNKLRNQFVGRSESRAKSRPRPQRGPNRTMCVIITDFKGIPDQIVKS